MAASVGAQTPGPARALEISAVPQQGEPDQGPQALKTAEANVVLHAVAYPVTPEASHRHAGQDVGLSLAAPSRAPELSAVPAQGAGPLSAPLAGTSTSGKVKPSFDGCMCCLSLVECISLSHLCH